MSAWPPSIVHAFLNSVERHPDKACLQFEGRRISFAQLLRDAQQWADALRGWGLRAGDRVALYLENSPAFVAAYLGTYLAGGIVVPVNVQYRRVELEHILSDAAVRLCLTDGPRCGELQRVLEALPALDAVIVRGPWDRSASPVHVAHAAPRPAWIAWQEFLAAAAGHSLELPRADA
ncbi:MAG: long-chain fatty acid--CoA ligase, partial [Chloroflexota bacterium]